MPTCPCDPRTRGSRGWRAPPARPALPSASWSRVRPDRTLTTAPSTTRTVGWSTCTASCTCRRTHRSRSATISPRVPDFARSTHGRTPGWRCCAATTRGNPSWRSWRPRTAPNCCWCRPRARRASFPTGTTRTSTGTTSPGSTAGCSSSSWCSSTASVSRGSSTSGAVPTSSTRGATSSQRRRSTRHRS